MDEFEKIFNEEDEETVAFLGLLDGLSTVKRMYIATVNAPEVLPVQFINRPGRFHYHIQFPYPSDKEIREYFGDIPCDDICSFTKLHPLTFDSLRAIKFELLLDPEATFKDVVTDLNSKRSGIKAPIVVKVTMSDGSTWTDSTNNNHVSKWLDSVDESLQVLIDPLKVVNGKVKDPLWWCEAELKVVPVLAEVSLGNERSYSY